LSTSGKPLTVGYVIKQPGEVVLVRLPDRAPLRGHVGYEGANERCIRENR
jgi:hypothetical protein